MNTKAKRLPSPLAGPLRARLNRAAHAGALAHETRLKALWMARALEARDAGASFDELAALIDTLETAPIPASASPATSD